MRAELIILLAASIEQHGLHVAPFRCVCMLDYIDFLLCEMYGSVSPAILN